MDQVQYLMFKPGPARVNTNWGEIKYLKVAGIKS